MNELHEILCEISLWQCCGFTAFCALGIIGEKLHAGDRLIDLWANVSAWWEVRAQERKARRRALYTLRTERIPGTTGYRIKTR